MAKFYKGDKVRVARPWHSGDTKYLNLVTEVESVCAIARNACYLWVNRTNWGRDTYMFHRDQLDLIEGGEIRRQAEAQEALTRLGPSVPFELKRRKPKFYPGDMVRITRDVYQAPQMAKGAVGYLQFTEHGCGYFHVPDASQLGGYGIWYFNDDDMELIQSGEARRLAEGEK